MVVSHEQLILVYSDGEKGWIDWLTIGLGSGPSPPPSPGYVRQQLGTYNRPHVPKRGVLRGIQQLLITVSTKLVCKVPLTKIDLIKFVVWMVFSVSLGKTH